MDDGNLAPTGKYSNEVFHYPTTVTASVFPNQALVLMQAALGGLPLEDWTLRNEQASMLDVSARLFGCCAESLAVCGRGGGLGCAVSLRLARSVRLKMWMDTEVKHSSGVVVSRRADT